MDNNREEGYARQDEVFSRKVRAGKRTYYVDVRSTRSGDDYYLTITESKRVGEDEREKFKIFLYKEDFEKFRDAFNEALSYVYGKLSEMYGNTSGKQTMPAAPAETTDDDVTSADPYAA